MNQFEIIIDSREKSYQHIIKYFDLKSIPWKKQVLKSGDYGCIINGALQPIIIERKSGLNELAGNFTKGRKRFEQEFERASNVDKILLVENSTYADIINHNYTSKMYPKALLASLLSFQFRFNLHIYFMPRENVGQFIYYSFYYYYHDLLKMERKGRENFE